MLSAGAARASIRSSLPTTIAPCPVSLPPPPRFVWWSSPESRASGVVSVLAIVETLLCVTLYWLLWLKWGVTWHHWLIVLATPLVLMRSEASVKRGLAWFEAYFDENKDIALKSVLGVTLALLSIALALGAAWVLSKAWLTDVAGWALAGRSVLVGLIVLTVGLAVSAASAGIHSRIFQVVGGFVLMGALAITAGGMFSGAGAVLGVVAAVAAVVTFATAGSLPVVYALMGPGLALGTWVRAVATRVVATARHPVAGLRALPRNWRYLVWHSDSLDPPELVPGHESTNFAQTFGSFTNAYEDKDLGDYIFAPSIFLVCYLPTLLWRWSIKSTAWFYLPLLWVGRGWQDLHGDDLLVWAKGYGSKWLNITGALLAAVLLGVSGVALIVPGDFFDLQQTLREAGAPLPVIGWAFVLDWQSLAAQPWQWFYLPSWILTLLLFFSVDDHGTDIRNEADPTTRLPALRRWMWVGNARTVLTNLGLLVALAYFLTAVDAWGQVVALFTRT